MKHWRNTPLRRLTTVATSVALALATIIVVSPASNPAYASMPNENDSYSPETLPSGGLWAYGTMAEARNTEGRALRMWRGADNLTIWASFDGGAPYAVQNGRSHFEPTVVPHGDGFAAFHTGTDDNIYWTRGNGQPGGWGPWQRIPNQTANGSVSATQVGTLTSRSTSVYIGYRGTGGGSQLWGSFFNGTSWSPADPMGHGLSETPPSLAWDQRLGRVQAALRGLFDNRVYVANLPYGSAYWSLWTPVPNSPLTYETPTLGIDGNGYLLLAVTRTDGYIYYARFSPWTGYWEGWNADNTGWRSIYSVTIQIIGTIFYTIMTGMNGQVYYKRAFGY